MGVGCQGPFIRGDNARAGCPCWGCKCCPPRCCPCLTLKFDCGSPQTPTNPTGCDTIAPQLVTAPIAPMPSFSKEPIISEDAEWIYSLSNNNCSIPCQQVTVKLYPQPVGGICCLEYTGRTNCAGTIYAVGSGGIDAKVAPPTGELSCGNFTVLINGIPAPVQVSDADIIVVSLVSEDQQCCQCVLTCVIDPCCPTMQRAFRGRGNKIMVNRREILDRLAQRQLNIQKRLRRSK